MPYDPSLPLPHSPLESQVIRDQLQALFNLISNIASVTAAQVDGVATLYPTDPATVSVSITGGVLHLSFGIPRGSDGPQGPAGEVTTTDMNAAIASAISSAIAGTSGNTNGISTLDTAPGDPPSLADYEALRAKVNELILNGRRP